MINCASEMSFALSQREIHTILNFKQKQGDSHPKEKTKINNNNNTYDTFEAVCSVGFLTIIFKTQISNFQSH